MSVPQLQIKARWDEKDKLAEDFEDYMTTISDENDLKHRAVRAAARRKVCSPAASLTVA